MLCDNPVDEPHEIEDRTITVGFAIDWGTDDLRDTWQGEYHFDSFRCLAQWATARSGDHDGRFVVEGTDVLVEPVVAVVASPTKTAEVVT